MRLETPVGGLDIFVAGKTDESKGTKDARAGARLSSEENVINSK